MQVTGVTNKTVWNAVLYLAIIYTLHQYANGEQRKQIISELRLINSKIPEYHDPAYGLKVVPIEVDDYIDSDAS